MAFQGVLNEKLPLLEAILEEANTSTNPVETLQHAAKRDGRVHVLLGYLINPKFRMKLPEGDPPYIPSDAPGGLAELDVLRLDKKIYVLYSSETKRMRKEEILVQWLEQMTEKEAKILIAIKDKDLTPLYPNLTEDVLVQMMGWEKSVYDKLKAG